MPGPGHAPDTLPALSHTSPPPGTAKARGAAWVGVGAFCALTVCWDFFPGQHSPPFPLESLVVSLEDGKRLLRRLQTFFFPLLASFSSKKKNPPPTKKPLNSQRVWPRGDTSGWRGGSDLCIPSPSRLPPGPAAPLPRAGSAPRPAAAAPAAAGLSSGMWRRGMCMQMRRARGGTGAGPGRSVC